MTEREVLARIIDPLAVPPEPQVGRTWTDEGREACSARWSVALAKADEYLSRPRPVAEGWEARARELEGALRETESTLVYLTRGLASVTRDRVHNELLPSIRLLLSGGSCSGEAGAAHLVMTDEAIGQIMQDQWDDICSDSGCWPMDIQRLTTRGPVRLSFVPGHWTSGIAEAIRQALAAPLPLVDDGWAPVPPATWKAMTEVAPALLEDPGTCREALEAAAARAAKELFEASELLEELGHPASAELARRAEAGLRLALSEGSGAGHRSLAPVSEHAPEPAAVGTLADEMKAARQRDGLSLQDVADRAGTTKGHVWELEDGRQTNPGVALLMGLSTSLDTPFSRIAEAARNTRLALSRPTGGA